MCSGAVGYDRPQMRASISIGNEYCDAARWDDPVVFTTGLCPRLERRLERVVSAS